MDGCTQPEKDIKDPETQPIFPTPNNFTSSNSLQNPATSIENFLYNFDWRRDYITQKAAKRIQEITDIEKCPFESAGDLLIPQPSPESSQETNTSEAQKEEEALQLLINQQRHRQREFKRRIQQLIMSNLE